MSNFSTPGLSNNSNLKKPKEKAEQSTNSSILTLAQAKKYFGIGSNDGLSEFTSGLKLLDSLNNSLMIEAAQIMLFDVVHRIQGRDLLAKDMSMACPDRFLAVGGTIAIQSLWPRYLFCSEIYNFGINLSTNEALLKLQNARSKVFANRLSESRGYWFETNQLLFVLEKWIERNIADSENYRSILKTKNSSSATYTAESEEYHANANRILKLIKSHPSELLIDTNKFDVLNQRLIEVAEIYNEYYPKNKCLVSKLSDKSKMELTEKCLISLESALTRLELDKSYSNVLEVALHCINHAHCSPELWEKFTYNLALNVISTNDNKLSEPIIDFLKSIKLDL